MDGKIKLLNEFYNTMQSGKVKLELMAHGFDFLAKLTQDGFRVEYGELAVNLVHKYRLLDVSEVGLKRLLEGHIRKEHNVCRYFDAHANTTFCLNLDNNCKVDNLELIPELEPTVRFLRQHLREYEIEPLVIQSGRGYHLWCRVDEAVENRMLYDFLLRIAAKAIASLHESDLDYRRVKFNLYPDPQTVAIASLRLFGSEHVKKKAFSHVHLDTQVLDERESWDYFACFAEEKTIPRQRFLNAYNAMMTMIPK
jgi:hypothetical protein